MKFNINEYKDSEDYKFAMHCKTLEEALDFCKYLHSNGRTWISGRLYIGYDNCHWNGYKENTLYYFNQGTYGPMESTHKENAIVLEWCDYMDKNFTKDDLKTGDVVKRRNGWIGIINRGFEMLISKSGWDDLDCINEDLTCKHDSDYDIVAVRRPCAKFHCIFDAFKYNFGELVYDRDRDETVEMSLEEICTALGKNIKIVKK